MGNIHDLAKAGVDGAVHSTAMTLSPDVVASLVLNGDLGKLSPPQQVAYYNALCERVQLDPATQPFKLLRLNGKLILYADKGATQQLSAVHKISHQVMSREKDEDVYTVTVRATVQNGGRFTDEDGCVSVAGLKGEGLANAKMKAMTKAKRRAVLALMGLGMLDETEIDTIEGAEIVPLATEVQQQLALPPAAPKNTSGLLETDAERAAREEQEKSPEQKAEEAKAVSEGDQWFKNACIVMAQFGEKGDKKSAMDWGYAAKHHLDKKFISREQFDAIIKIFREFWPPVVKPAEQTALFNADGTPAAPAPAPQPAPAPAPAAPVEPPPEKKTRRKKPEAESDAMLAEIEGAEKVSKLFTLKGRVEKSKTFDDVQKKYFCKVIDEKIANLKVK